MAFVYCFNVILCIYVVFATHFFGFVGFYVYILEGIFGAVAVAGRRKNIIKNDIVASVCARIFWYEFIAWRFE